jgi:cytochrome P450
MTDFDSPRDPTTTTSSGAPQHRAPALDAFDPFDPVVQQCPYPMYTAMRETSPAFRLEGTDLYFVTRRDLIVRILRDTATFSNRFGQAAEPPPADLVDQIAAIRRDGWPQVPTIANEDPPLHDRYRELVAPFYAPSRIAGFEPRIKAHCERLLDAWVGDGHVELVERFAGPLPLLVTVDLMDLDPGRVDDYARWSSHAAAAVGSHMDDERWEQTQRSIVDMQQYFATEMHDRRGRPRVDDLLTAIAAAQIPDLDGQLWPIELPVALSICQQLFVGGIETTTKLLTEALLLLARHPDEYQLLRDDPARIPVVIEEALRMSTPAQALYRLVTHDVDLDGIHIPAGSKVVVVYAAANRDPAQFHAPDQFDPDRLGLNAHLAFGRGAHFCLGAGLARLEARIALDVLTRRVERWNLTNSNTLEYEPSFILRGLKSLDLRFSADLTATTT